MLANGFWAGGTLMKKLVMIAAVSLTVTACQTTGDGGLSGSQATKAEVEASIIKSLTCQMQAIAKIDDRRSDARTIGRIVATRCRREARETRLVYAWYKGMSPHATAQFLDMDDRDVEMATEVVLVARSNSRR